MREKSTCRKLAYLLSKSTNGWQLYWRAFYKLYRYVEFTGLFSMFFQLKPTLGCFFIYFSVRDPYSPSSSNFRSPRAKHTLNAKPEMHSFLPLFSPPLHLFDPFNCNFLFFILFFLYLSQNFSLFSHSSFHIFPPEWHRPIFIFPKGGVFSIMYTPELAFTAHVRKICICITLWLIQINIGKKLLEWNFSWCCV